MGGGFDAEYTPDNQKADFYALRYKKYNELSLYIEQQTANLKYTITCYEQI
jgi:hypothetical protein